MTDKGFDEHRQIGIMGLSHCHSLNIPQGTFFRISKKKFLKGFSPIMEAYFRQRLQSHLLSIEGWITSKVNNAAVRRHVSAAWRLIR